MLKSAKVRFITSAALTLVVWAPLALGQDQGGGGDRGGRGGGRGGRGGRGGWDPAQMQERMLQMQKEQLKVSEEEWTVLKPLLQAVTQKQWEQRMARFRGMGRRGRGGGEGEDNSPAEVKALRTALENADTPAADIQAKLKALRDANKAKEAELEKVREQLRQVLTVRQEAQLVLMGVLN